MVILLALPVLHLLGRTIRENLLNLHNYKTKSMMNLQGYFTTIFTEDAKLLKFFTFNRSITGHFSKPTFNKGK